MFIQRRCRHQPKNLYTNTNRRWRGNFLIDYYTPVSQTILKQLQMQPFKHPCTLWGIYLSNTALPWQTSSFQIRPFSPKKNCTHNYRNFYANKLLLYREVFTTLSSCLIFHDHSPSVAFISSFFCSFGQLPPSFSFHFARCSVRPRFVLAPSAAKQTKREPRNT